MHIIREQGAGIQQKSEGSKKKYKKGAGRMVQNKKGAFLFIGK